MTDREHESLIRTTDPKAESYPPMARGLKAEWLEALRGGKYEQGKETLRDTAVTGTTAYCCLGVLCNLYDPRAWRFADSAQTYGEWEYDDEGDTGELPDGFRERVALLADSAETKLIRMNDAGASFMEIAAWIEANL